MMLLTDSNNTVGFYMPSYKRWETVHDRKIVSGCTYVVRKSEEDLYRGEGVDVLAVPDEEINSLGKVRQWIIDNAKEDVVIQIDDDVSYLCYELKANYIGIEDEEVVIQELLRISQLLIDLKLGFATLTMTPDVRKHIAEFIFKGVGGGVCWFNRKAVKGKYEKDLLKVDTDFLLQELLYNRIALFPDYLGMVSKYDKNKGGNNTAKTSQRLYNANEYLKNKWGKYYDFDYQHNQTKVRVER